MITHAPRATHPSTAPATARSSAATALVLAGVLFATYPSIRPYSDETTLAGAAAMASTAWLVAHTSGMIAFAALAIGLRLLLTPTTAMLAVLAPTTPMLAPPTDRPAIASISPRPAGLATGMAWLGTLLVLPYYGAETFGLRVIGARAVADGDPTMLEMAEAMRYDPTALGLFGAGLLALAVAGIALAVALWRGGPGHRLGGVLVGAGLALYLPQFLAPPAVRIAHGVMLALGCLALGFLALGGPPLARPSRGL